MSTGEPAPRLLLVEDDPVSAAFLMAALEGCGAVDHAATLAAASAAIGVQRPHALICDCRLPDGHASQLAALLGEHGQSLPPAIALSADVQPDDVERLQAAGFRSVLRKPLSAGALRDAAMGLLGTTQTSPWSNAAADAALGLPPAQRRQLRQLLLQELPRQRERAGAAMENGDLVALDAELHRLVASCGFCGASELGGAVSALRANPDVQHWRAFEAACERLLATGGESA